MEHQIDVMISEEKVEARIKEIAFFRTVKIIDTIVIFIIVIGWNEIILP